MNGVFLFLVIAHALTFRVAVEQHRDIPGSHSLPPQQHFMGSNTRSNIRLASHQLPDDTYGNLFYRVNISIGTPPQPFLVAIDIFSLMPLFVPSSECRAWECTDPPAGKDPKNFYNSSKSESYVRNGTQIGIYWAGMRYMGVLSKDNLHFGDFSIPRQLFEEYTEVTAVNVPGTAWGCDGVMGLAPPWASEWYFRSIFGELVTRDMLDSPIFSLRLPKNTSDQGALLFGQTERDLYEGNITFIPLAQPKYGSPGVLNGWSVSVESITLNSPREIYFAMPPRSYAILDTSWPYIYLPSSMHRIVVEELGAEPTDPDHVFFTVPCGRRPHLPTLTFRLGGHNFTIGAFDYVVEMDMTEDPSEPHVTCALSLMSATLFGGPDNILILSSPFLRGFYSVFDAGNKQVGLANLS